MDDVIEQVATTSIRICRAERNTIELLWQVQIIWVYVLNLAKRTNYKLELLNLVRRIGLHPELYR